MASACGGSLLTCLLPVFWEQGLIHVGVTDDVILLPPY